MALRGHTHQDDAQAPQVAGLVVAGVAEQLRGGVVQGEARGLQGLIVRRLQAGKPEIDHFDFQVVVLISEQQILQDSGTCLSFLGKRSAEPTEAVRPLSACPV